MQLELSSATDVIELKLISWKQFTAISRLPWNNYAA
jgi:hypothetical protein